MEYFFWDSPNIEISNAMDSDAVVATLKAIHAPKFDTFLELAQHIEALRARGNEDFKNNNVLDALSNYERARQIYYASMQTRIAHSWRFNTGPDYPNLEEIKFALFYDISAAYLKLAKQGGPDQLQLGIAAVEAAQDAQPPPPYFRPSEAQRAKVSHCLGAAAHLIGDLLLARSALRKVAGCESEDLAVQQELLEVEEALAADERPFRCHPKLDEARKERGWYFRFVADNMISHQVRMTQKVC